MASVQSFVDATGATFPVLRNGGFLMGSGQYAVVYDNYVVVDALGIVRYTSVGEIFGALGRFNATTVRAAILQYLPLPAGEPTWSAIKQLYR